MRKYFSTILLLLFIGSTFYYYRETWANFLFPPIPCKKAIAYSIGDIDSRFEITKEKLLEIVQSSEKVWEDAEHKELFTYDPEGKLIINLVYDYRQQTTDKLSDIGGDINEGTREYERLKAQYAKLTAEYNSRIADYEEKSEDFDRDKKAYDDKVAYWNSQGGAPEEEYEELQEDRVRLESRSESLNKDAQRINALTKQTNEIASDLNALAKKLNLKVSTYNTIGATTKEEFNEGEYIVDEQGTRINVYQFDSLTSLRRLFEHELGHALGLGHVEDQDAVMYRLNSSKNQDLTADDLKELQKVCGK